MIYISGGMAAAIASRWAPIRVQATISRVACTPGEKTPITATPPPSEAIEATTTPVASSISTPAPSQKPSLFPTLTPAPISTPVLTSTPANPPSPTPVTPEEPAEGTQEIDSIPPIVLGFSPEGGSILNEAQPIITVTFIDQGGSGIDPTGVAVTLDGIAVEGTTTILETKTAIFTFVSDAGLAEGIHRVTAEAMDLAGNKGNAATTTFTIDLTPPTVTIAVLPGDRNRATKTVTIQFSDVLSGVSFDTRKVTINGVDRTQDGEFEGNSWTLVELLKRQSHVIEAQVQDLAGNTKREREAFDIISTPPDFKVAFIGDQGLTVGAKAVLQLIKDEGAQMVIHSGAFDYDDNPDAWDQQIDDILGPGFPYFASVGNHDILDESAWPSYQAKYQARLDMIEGAVCTGDLGVQSVCHY